MGLHCERCKPGNVLEVRENLSNRQKSPACYRTLTKTANEWQTVQALNKSEANK